RYTALLRSGVRGVGEAVLRPGQVYLSMMQRFPQALQGALGKLGELIEEKNAQMGQGDFPRTAASGADETRLGHDVVGSPKGPLHRGRRVCAGQARRFVDLA